VRGRERSGLSENQASAFKACSERCDRLLRIHYLYTSSYVSLEIVVKMIKRTLTGTSAY